MCTTFSLGYIRPILRRKFIQKDTIGVLNVLQAYNSQDWKTYIKIGENTYNKKKIFDEKDFDLYIITWDKYQASDIHSHQEKGCYFRVLQGMIEESEFDGSGNFIRKNLITSYDLSNYTEGVHSVQNIIDNIAVTMHIYPK